MHRARHVLISAVTASAFVFAGGWDLMASDSVAHAVVPASPEDGGPRRWQVLLDVGARLSDGPALDAEILSKLDAGAILRNFGCMVHEGRTWCDVQALRGGPRGFVEAGALRPAVGPDGTTPAGPDDSARRAGKRDFDDTGRIQCAQVRGQPMQECTVGIARSGGGDATAIVTFGNGFSRELYFAHGVFVRANTTMSGNGTDVEWRREGPLHLIRVDDQRYEIPDSFIVGP